MTDLHQSKSCQRTPPMPETASRSRQNAGKTALCLFRSLRHLTIRRRVLGFGIVCPVDHVAVRFFNGDIFLFQAGVLLGGEPPESTLAERSL